MAVSSFFYRLQLLSIRGFLSALLPMSLSPWEWLNATNFVWPFSEDITDTLARTEDFYHLLQSILSWRWGSLWKKACTDAPLLVEVTPLWLLRCFYHFLILKWHLKLISCWYEILLLARKKMQQHIIRSRITGDDHVNIVPLIHLTIICS